MARPYARAFNQVAETFSSYAGNHNRGLAELQDGRSLDFYFAFTHPLDGTRVALWAHQDRLASAGYLANLYQIPTDVENNPGPSNRAYKTTGAIASFAPYNWMVRSVVTHCVILRYIYTGQLELQVNFDDFWFTAMDGLLPVGHTGDANVPHDAFAVELVSSPIRIAVKEDVLELANGYKMWDLVKSCFGKLQAPGGAGYEVYIT
ncbi:hypothetical protein BG003_000254 [Podila horticola]|nr:hypothetical protein BG003_000254 [Podila horticola]